MGGYLAQTLVTLGVKVSEVVGRYPATTAVFRRSGCPDMSKGIFRLMCRVMSVRAAARVHRLPLEAVVRELNAAAQAGD